MYLVVSLVEFLVTVKVDPLLRVTLWICQPSSHCLVVARFPNKFVFGHQTQNEHKYANVNC
jgi:hypothetical protein